jgi:hypothetical protein
MRSIDIKNVLQTTLQNLEQSAELRENDPSMLELKGTLIRTIAELEIARLQRGQTAEPTQTAEPAGIVTPSEAPKEGDVSVIASVT